MEILGRYIYGSGNSLDTDMVYLVDQMPVSIADCKKFCNDMKEGNENLNIAVIKDGVISECFKGTVDELNNAIYCTYGLHEQDTKLMIERMVERDKYLKVIRSVRSILSHFSKSCLRGKIKSALRGSWSDRLSALCDISLLGVDEVDLGSLNPNMSARDVMKLVAFQIGQVRGLFEGDELYTKKDISDRYGILRKYLDRDSDDWEGLSNILYNCFYLYLMGIGSLDIGDCGVVFIDGETGGRFEYDLRLEKKVG